jgi:hypothetical protein
MPRYYFTDASLVGVALADIRNGDFIPILYAARFIEAISMGKHGQWLVRFPRLYVRAWLHGTRVSELAFRRASRQIEQKKEERSLLSVQFGKDT